MLPDLGLAPDALVPSAMAKLPVDPKIGRRICTCLASEGIDVTEPEPAHSVHNSWCDSKTGHRWIEVGEL